MRHLLREQGFDLVAEASDARSIFPLIDEKRPDVVLLDLRLPGMDGVTATRELHNRAPQSKVMILSAFTRQHDLDEAWAAGVHGYATKTQDADGLRLAIHAVGAGRALSGARADTDGKAERARGAARPLVAARARGLSAARARNDDATDCRRADHQRQDRRYASRAHLEEARRCTRPSNWCASPPITTSSTSNPPNRITASHADTSARANGVARLDAVVRRHVVRRRRRLCGRRRARGRRGARAGGAVPRRRGQPLRHRRRLLGGALGGDPRAGARRPAQGRDRGDQAARAHERRAR